MNLEQLSKPPLPLSINKPEWMSEYKKEEDFFTIVFVCVCLIKCIDEIRRHKLF